MIVTSYPAEDLYALIPDALQYHDPLLVALDPLIDEAMVAQVRADVCRRWPQSATRGRPSTPAEVIVRMLLLRRLYDWSFAETVCRVADSISLRQFCRVGTHAVPAASTLDRWATWVRPTTLDALNRQLVEQARQHGITRGRKLRLDTTVVETLIHYPSDSTLLADGVRVLSRLIGTAKAVVGGPSRLFRNRVRSARRRAQAIGESTRRRGEAGRMQRERQYRDLLRITRATVGQARQVLDRFAPGQAPRLQRAVQEMLDRTEQVMRQTTRRLAGQAVPAAEKLVSLFEPHTAIIGNVPVRV